MNRSQLGVVTRVSIDSGRSRSTVAQASIYCVVGLRSFPVREPLFNIIVIIIIIIIIINFFFFFNRRRKVPSTLEEGREGQLLLYRTVNKKKILGESLNK